MGFCITVSQSAVELVREGDGILSSPARGRQEGRHHVTLRNYDSYRRQACNLPSSFPAIGRWQSAKGLLQAIRNFLRAKTAQGSLINSLGPNFALHFRRTIPAADDDNNDDDDNGALRRKRPTLQVSIPCRRPARHLRETPPRDPNPLAGIRPIATTTTPPSTTSREHHELPGHRRRRRHPWHPDGRCSRGRSARAGRVRPQRSQRQMGMFSSEEVEDRVRAWLTERGGQLTNAMESCYAKTAMSGVAGFALGGLFGMFMASVSRPSFRRSGGGWGCC